MFSALLLTSLIDTLPLGPRPMMCTFPAAAEAEAPLELRVIPRPSLKDANEVYRVEFDIGGERTLFGAAQPLTSTKRRDVILRAVENRTRFYTLGVDDAGGAALNVLDTAETTVNSRDNTRVGRCRNFERYLDTWVAS